MNLKKYPQISYRGCSQKCQNYNFLHLFVALLQEAHFLKEIKDTSHDSIFQFSLFSTLADIFAV